MVVAPGRPSEDGNARSEGSHEALVAPGPTAVFNVGLLHPAAQTGIGDPEIRGDLAGWLLTQPSKLNRALTELRRVWSGHRNILPEATIVASGSMSANPGEAQ
jgi:hypothetical protein